MKLDICNKFKIDKIKIIKRTMVILDFAKSPKPFIIIS